MMYGFDKLTAERVVEAARLTLQHPMGADRAKENSLVGALPPHTVIFKVTNTNPTNGFWQCNWCSTDIINTGDPAITFATEGEQGWAYGLNGAVLQQDQFYFGQFRGYKPDDSRAVFVASVASTVVVKCTSATPTQQGSIFIFPGVIQTWRGSNLTFGNSKVVWLQDVNNANPLTLDRRYLGLILGNRTSDGIPVVAVEHNTGGGTITVKDLHTNTTLTGITTIEWLSTATAYDNTKGDIVLTNPSTGVAQIRLNGHTGSKAFVVGCLNQQLQFETVSWANGLTKTVVPT